MDSLISAAARALAAGDALTALKHVALREDPPALALRGIAMAQLGELARARELLRRAARGFGPQEPAARARCLVAEAEVALAQRDFAAAPAALEAAMAVLEARGDRANALQARLIARAGSCCWAAWTPPLPCSPQWTLLHCHRCPPPSQRWRPPSWRCGRCAWPTPARR